MHKRLVTIAVAAMSLPALGFATYGAAHAVSASPGPHAAIPVSFHPSIGGADDPANHEVNEAPGADDPAGHDADDSPGQAPGASTTAITPPATATVTTQTTLSRSDDGPRHDLFDDHGGRLTVSPTSVTTAPSGRDDNGSSSSGASGNRSGGDDSSGSSRRDSGNGNDGPGHN